MKLRKLFILGFTAVQALILTGCNKNTRSSISLNIWTYYNGSIESSFQDIITEFNETKGAEEKIVVSSLSEGSKVSDLSDALIASAKNELGSDKMPDMFISYADCAYELDKLGKLASIDDYFSDLEFSNFNSDFLNEGRFDGKLKILPVSKSTEALYINKTDFDKFLLSNPDCGVSYDDLSTFEGLIKVSKAYYEKTGKAFFGRDSMDNYFVIGAKQLGIDILDYNDEKFGINFNHDVFKKLWDSYYIPYVLGYFDSIGKFRSSDIQAGVILAYIGSTSSGGYFPKKVFLNENDSYEIEEEIRCIPVFEGGSMVSVSQGAGFCITKSTKEREEASAIFLKWLCERDNISTFSKSSGYFPATKDGFSDDFINSLDSRLYKNNFKICKETLDNYKMYTNIVGLNGTDYRNFLRDSFNLELSNAKAMIKNSSNKEEMINYLTSPEYFEKWYLSLKEQSNSIGK